MSVTMSDRLQTSKVTLFKSIKQNGRRACLALFAAACLLLGSTVAVHAADAASGTNTLQSVDIAALPGNKAQITLTLSNPAPAPLSFTIDNPARIALDFPNTNNGLAQRSQNIGIGMAESLTAVEAQGRTRVVVNLVGMVPYEAHADGNKIILTIQNAGNQMSDAAIAAARASGDGDESISNIDFRRGEDGQGRVIVSLSDPSVPVDMQQQGGKVLVDFYRTQLPAELERRLDVLDFATPVKTIDTYTKGDNVHMVITPMGEYEYIAYQTDNQFTIEISRILKSARYCSLLLTLPA
jgi:type IV pilus assembly protein PilQ